MKIHNLFVKYEELKRTNNSDTRHKKFVAQQRVDPKRQRRPRLKVRLRQELGL